MLVIPMSRRFIISFPKVLVHMFYTIFFMCVRVKGTIRPQYNPSQLLSIYVKYASVIYLFMYASIFIAMNLILLVHPINL